MTLLVTIFAAVISTVLWYKSAPKSDMNLGLLCWLFWGAAIMWLIDAVFEYIELGSEYFTPAPSDMLNDLFLGLCAVALALVIWLIVLLIRDPKGVIRDKLFKKK